MLRAISREDWPTLFKATGVSLIALTGWTTEVISLYQLQLREIASHIIPVDGRFSRLSSYILYDMANIPYPCSPIIFFLLTIYSNAM